MSAQLIIERDLALTAEAWFSPCYRYRYYLRRCFTGSVASPAVNPVAFCMLNPSKASAFITDPTITRCTNFAKAWGYTDLIVVNLFAIRETNSSALRTYADPQGPENNCVIAELPRCPIIAAWGAHPLAAERARCVQIILSSDRLRCLRLTKSGAPGHPLYLPQTLTPIPYKAR